MMAINLKSDHFTPVLFLLWLFLHCFWIKLKNWENVFLGFWPGPHWWEATVPLQLLNVSEQPVEGLPQKKMDKGALRKHWKEPLLLCGCGWKFLEVPILKLCIISYHISWLYISKGTSKASAVNLSRPNTLEESKTAF